MAMALLSLFSLLLASLAAADAVTFDLAQRTRESARLQRPSIGISFEFFKFPEYIAENPSTHGCLANLADAQGGPPPIRIGGNTADFATYDPHLKVAVTYPAIPTDGRKDVVFGPQFIKLASQLKGPVVFNLNRRADNLSNTILAAKAVVKTMSNLDAIEIGNEPDIFRNNSPIVEDHGGQWSPSIERQTQLTFQKQVAEAVARSSTQSIFQAGVYAFYNFQFGIPELVQFLKTRSKATRALIKYFSVHHYANTAKMLNTTMSHAFIVNDTADVKAQFDAAHKFGVPGRYGEANSHASGGIEGLSNTFGASLWTVDFTFQALINGAQLINFHQRENVTCRYCWWKHQYVESPFYGGYAVASALKGASSVAMLDDGKSNYAAYALFSGNKAFRAVFINSDFYPSTSSSSTSNPSSSTPSSLSLSTRPSQNFTLTGLLPYGISKASARRLTAPFATSITEQGEIPSFAGQVFEDGTCKLKGSEVREVVSVDKVKGEITVTLAASEALVVDFV